MASKNDLSALKLTPKNTLGNLQTPKQPVEAIPTAKVWRKPKLPKEKQTKVVWLRFTQSEYNEIKTQAGLIPIATYIKRLIIDKHIL